LDALLLSEELGEAEADGLWDSDGETLADSNLVLYVFPATLSHPLVVVL
jgi:hypothetical protein